MISLYKKILGVAVLFFFFFSLIIIFFVVKSSWQNFFVTFGTCGAIISLILLIYLCRQKVETTVLYVPLMDAKEKTNRVSFVLPEHTNSNLENTDN